MLRLIIVSLTPFPYRKHAYPCNHFLLSNMSFSCIVEYISHKNTSFTSEACNNNGEPNHHWYKILWQGTTIFAIVFVNGDRKIRINGIYRICGFARFEVWIATWSNTCLFSNIRFTLGCIDTSICRANNTAPLRDMWSSRSGYNILCKSIPGSY